MRPLFQEETQGEKGWMEKGEKKAIYLNLKKKRT